MRTTVVYDKSTGRIVHAHCSEPGTRRTEEEVLRLVDPSIDRARLATLSVKPEEMRAGETYHVNPDTKKLEPVNAGVNFSASFRKVHR